MQILRVQPYNTAIEISVSESQEEYSVVVEDMADRSRSTTLITSSNASKITVTLPSRYDNSYLIMVDEKEIFVEVVRPYVDPNTKGTTASEISEYSKNEELARAIIDSVIRDGFYYKKELQEHIGLGADYLPIWSRAQKLLKLYENNVLIFDIANSEDFPVQYGLSEDKTAITILSADIINKDEGAPIMLPAAESDSWDLVYGYRGFPKSFDFVSIIETGYHEVPSDIVRATEMLIDDISCGKLDYYKRYVSDYNTDQFKIKFDQQLFDGTGNILVDKILSKYSKTIRRLGVL
jgi:hypothetical protein